MDLIDPFDGAECIDGGDILQDLSDDQDVMLNFTCSGNQNPDSGERGGGGGDKNVNEKISVKVLRRSCHSEPVNFLPQASGSAGGDILNHDVDNARRTTQQNGDRSCTSDQLVLNFDEDRRLKNIVNDSSGQDVAIGSTIKISLPPLKPIQAAEQRRGRARRATAHRRKRANSSDAHTNMMLYAEEPLFGGDGGNNAQSRANNFGMSHQAFLGRSPVCPKSQNGKERVSDVNDVASACSAPADLLELTGFFDEDDTRQGNTSGSMDVQKMNDMGAVGGNRGNVGTSNSSVIASLKPQQLPQQKMLHQLLVEDFGNVGDNNGSMGARFQSQQRPQKNMLQQLIDEYCGSESANLQPQQLPQQNMLQQSLCGKDCGNVENNSRGDSASFQPQQLLHQHMPQQLIVKGCGNIGNNNVGVSANFQTLQVPQQNNLHQISVMDPGENGNGSGNESASFRPHQMSQQHMLHQLLNEDCGNVGNNNGGVSTNFQPLQPPQQKSHQQLLGENCGNIRSNNVIENANFQPRHLPEQKMQQHYQPQRRPRRRSTAEGCDAAFVSLSTIASNDTTSGGHSRCNSFDGPPSDNMLPFGDGNDPNIPTTMEQFRNQMDFNKNNANIGRATFPCQDSSSHSVKRRKSEPLIELDFLEDTATTNAWQNDMGWQQQQNADVAVALNNIMTVNQMEFDSNNVERGSMMPQCQDPSGPSLERRNSEPLMEFDFFKDTATTNVRQDNMGQQKQQQPNTNVGIALNKAMAANQHSINPQVDSVTSSTFVATANEAYESLNRLKKLIGKPVSAQVNSPQPQVAPPMVEGRIAGSAVGLQQQIQTHQLQQEELQQQMQPQQIKLQGFLMRENDGSNKFVQQGNPFAPSSFASNQRKAPAPQVTTRTEHVPPASKTKPSSKSSLRTATPAVVPNIPLPEKSDSEILKLDRGKVMCDLQSAMDRTEDTQKLLQEWDRANGLPKSHSQTMVNSSRSRKQLTDGIILKKWNGAPLLNFVNDRSNTGL